MDSTPTLTRDSEGRMGDRDRSVVSVVDDDESLRRSLRNLLRSVGFGVETFASAEEFLRSARRENTGCLVLDLRMTGMSGLDRQVPQEVEAAHPGHPQIEHQATCVLSPGGPQELLRRGERLDAEAHRPQEIPEGPPQ